MKDIKIKEILLQFLDNYDTSLSKKESDQIHVAEILDSVSMLEFILFLEKKFNLKIEDYDVTAENFYSLTNIISYIEKKLDF